MAAFFANFLLFPTVIFTFFLCLSLILGLLTIFGLFDVDAGDVGGLDIDAGDVGSHLDHGMHTTGEAVGFLSRFGLNGIPITLGVSLLSLFGWMVSYIAQALLLSHIHIAIIYYPAGIVVFIAAFAASVWLTAQVCKPLRRIVFKNQDAPSNRSFLGQTVTVRSSYVNERFGEAVLNDGEAGMILDIVADASKGIKRGDRVVLIEYLEDSRTYRVISEDEFKGY